MVEEKSGTMEWLLTRTDAFHVANIQMPALVTISPDDYAILNQELAKKGYYRRIEEVVRPMRILVDYKLKAGSIRFYGEVVGHPFATEEL